MTTEQRTKSRQGPPPFALLAAEVPRAFMESLTLHPAAPLLRSAPRGDGHPVLVLPGFTAGDRSTRVLRRILSDLGHDAQPWLLGPNLGPRDDMREMLTARVDDLYQSSGQKLSLIGWSLGGIYAREIAKRAPDRIRQVITMGSPFGDINRPSNAGRLYRRFSESQMEHDRDALAASLRLPPPVPSTSIYSKTDGIVQWRACLELETERTENIEVPGSHIGFGFNPLVLYAIADRLSQPEGGWQPFDRTSWRRCLYG